jgi:hypothetical protein
MSTVYPQSDNAYGDESRDVEKSAKFAEIMKSREAILSQLADLQEKERRLHQELLDLAGFRKGQTVELRPGTLGILNNVRAEPFLALRGNVVYLRIAGDCSPLTASGQPSKRETHARFRHILWHVETTMSPEEMLHADKTAAFFKN